jgi:hypothetical protein
LELGKYGHIFGGDNEFGNLSSRTYAYIPFFKEKLVWGLRFYARCKWGDVPFYALPYISLRGIPAMRYQDNYVGVSETELRWNVFRRWSLVGFTGVGFTAHEMDEFRLDEGKVTYGGGFRYFLAKDYNMHAGIDVAKGPEVWTWYIVFGSNWFR